MDYRKSGCSKQFFEAYREEILLHKAAKEAFGQLSGSIPKIKELNQELQMAKQCVAPMGIIGSGVFKF